MNLCAVALGMFISRAMESRMRNRKRGPAGEFVDHWNHVCLLRVFPLLLLNSHPHLPNSTSLIQEVFSSLSLKAPWRSPANLMGLLLTFSEVNTIRQTILIQSTTPMTRLLNPRTCQGVSDEVYEEKRDGQRGARGETIGSKNDRGGEMRGLSETSIGGWSFPP